MKYTARVCVSFKYSVVDDVDACIDSPAVSVTELTLAEGLRFESRLGLIFFVCNFRSELCQLFKKYVNLNTCVKFK